MPIFDRKCPRLCGYIDFKAPLFENSLGFATEFGPIDASRSRRRMGIEEQVLGNGEIGNERRLLINACDAIAPLLWLIDAGGVLTRETDTSRIWRNHTG